MTDADLESLWAQRARTVTWIRRPRRVRDRESAAWFPDGTLNSCYNALDRHVVHGHGDRPALVTTSTTSTTSRARSGTTSSAQLLEQVAAFAGVLQALGVGPGDRVVLHLPSLPEAVVAMLGCARIGAVHAAVPVGTGVRGLADHVDRHRPPVVVTASCAVTGGSPVPLVPALDEALALATHQPPSVLVVQRPQLPAPLREPRDVDWGLAMRAGAGNPAGCVPVAAPDPLYAVPGGGAGAVSWRDNGGHAVATTWAAEELLGLRPDTLVWAPEDVATEAGHAGCWGPLLAGASTLVHELAPGSAVDATTLGRVVAEHGVTTLLLSREAAHGLRGQDPDGAALGSRDLPTLHTVLVGTADPAAGPVDPDVTGWLQRLLGVPARGVGWPVPTPEAADRTR